VKSNSQARQNKIIYLLNVDNRLTEVILCISLMFPSIPESLRAIAESIVAARKLHYDEVPIIENKLER
jgi:hypothetical protein